MNALPNISFKPDLAQELEMLLAKHGLELTQSLEMTLGMPRQESHWNPDRMDQFNAYREVTPVTLTIVCRANSTSRWHHESGNDGRLSVTLRPTP